MSIVREHHGHYLGHGVHDEDLQRMSAIGGLQHFN
jgi:hypothetical protein